ncbi:LacI family DNA-binding transcriptional regulator [Streptomyces roseirectus]|uniref:LacI family DNA-binding transcriptional regulator n=1 Tax=Streptomyces roseirectus TaxID=2768066 RepID=A0A7H0ING3_9ACTN|nr:LacI family DNA-binding transcriptional regulator [Streptomyces roseirectus]QNP74329.1 LacI family DNA-binding transcriptional regulator [Streptomyces roseirectus]
MVQIPTTPAPPTPPAPRPVPTSADVARLAGVSRATVSYVLNNTSAVRISEPTRQRVHDAARELGYVPHAAARSLRAGHSRMVLMPAPAVAAGPLYSQFVHDLQQALSQIGYTVVQYGASGMHGQEAVRSWAELRPVAVLVPGNGISAEGVAVLKRSGAKAVVVLAAEHVPGAHTLILDHADVGRLAARHLHERGRRRIGVVVPVERGMDMFSGPRLAGVREELAGTGAEVVALPMAHTEESAAELAARWPELGLDAVFGYNDEYALPLARALQDRGVDIPGDVAVVGADDLLIARLARPRLTSVAIRLPAGPALADLVDRAVHRPGTEAEHPGAIQVALVVRESS